MISGMTGFDGDECSAPRGANFSARRKFDFNLSAIICGFDHARREQDGRIGRRRAQKFDGVFSRHGAGQRGGSFVALHQKQGGGPVGMAINERTDDAAVQHAGERFVMFLRLPFADHFAVAAARGAP